MFLLHKVHLHSRQAMPVVLLIHLVVYHRRNHEPAVYLPRIRIKQTSWYMDTVLRMPEGHSPKYQISYPMSRGTTHVPRNGWMKDVDVSRASHGRDIPPLTFPRNLSFTFCPPSPPSRARSPVSRVPRFHDGYHRSHGCACIRIPAVRPLNLRPPPVPPLASRNEEPRGIAPPN